MTLSARPEPSGMVGRQWLTLSIRISPRMPLVLSVMSTPLCMARLANDVQVV